MAAGSTYTPIATQTLGSAAASVTFSSISGAYTDLVLVTNMAIATVNGSIYIRFNGDSGNNYSYTNLYGDGSTVGSVRGTNANKTYISWYVSPNTALEAVSITNIMNYSNATTYKSFLSRGNRASASNSPGTEAIVGMWRNTAAITSFVITADSGNISTGSTFTLYGIAAA